MAKIYQELQRGSFLQRESEQIYSLLSDFNILKLAPREFQKEIIYGTIEVLKNSTDVKIIREAIYKLDQIAKQAEFSDFKKDIMEVYFLFLEDKSQLALTYDENFSKEALAQLDTQMTYTLINKVLQTDNQNYSARILQLIQKNKKLGGLMTDVLVGQEEKIRNKDLIQYVEKEIANRLPVSPNYEKILANGKVVFELDFLSDAFFKQWQMQILGSPTVGKINNKGFHVTEKKDHGWEIYLYTKNLNGIPVELKVVKPGKKRNTREDLFDALQREDVDGKWYFGHATAGYELEPAILKMFEDSRYQINDSIDKIIGLSACSS